MSLSTSTTVVDLGDLIDPQHELLAGDEWGLQVRQAAKLDELDRQLGLHVEIHVPERITGMTSSFVRGLLRPSITYLGADGFREKYTLVGEDFDDVLNDEIERAFRFRNVA